MDVHRLARVSNYKGLTVRCPEDPKNARLRGAHPSDISSSHDRLQNFITSTFVNIGTRVSQSGDRVTGICLSPTKY